MGGEKGTAGSDDRIAVLIAIASVSMGAVLIRFSASGPMTISFYRLLFTTLMVAPWALHSDRAQLKNLSRRDVLILAAIGLVLAAHFGLWVTSLQYTSVANSVVLVTTHPLFVALIATIFLAESPGKVGIAGGIIAIAGVGVMFFGGLSGGSILGDVLAFGGALAAGTYIVAGRSQRKKLSTGTYCLVVYGFATLFLAPLAFAESGLAPATGNDWLFFVLMGLVPGIMGHTMYNYALGKVSAFVVSTSLLGEPIISTCLAYLIFAEAIPSWTFVGAPLIFAGIVLAAWGAERKGKAKRQDDDKVIQVNPKDSSIEMNNRS